MKLSITLQTYWAISARVNKEVPVEKQAQFDSGDGKWANIGVAKRKEHRPARESRPELVGVVRTKEEHTGMLPCLFLDICPKIK